MTAVFTDRERVLDGIDSRYCASGYFPVGRIFCVPDCRRVCCFGRVSHRRRVPVTAMKLLRVFSAMLITALSYARY